MATSNTSASLVSLSGTDALASSSQGSQKPSKLHDAAQQFEALMIGEMMKSVRDDSDEGWMGGGGGTGDDTAMDMAEQQFSKAMSMNGGLGLTQMIEKSMSPRVNASPKSTGSSTDTAIALSKF